jgi:hypothetical protein
VKPTLSLLHALIVVLCCSVTATTWAQLPVTGAVYHFDATSIDPLNLNEVRIEGANTRVHTWVDLTGNLDQAGNLDFVSHSDVNRHPLYVPSARLTTGSNPVDLPALVFDGNDHLLSPTGVTGLNGATGVTLFAVGRQPSTITGSHNGFLQAFDGNRKLSIQVEPEGTTPDPTDVRFNYRVTGNNPQIRHAVLGSVGTDWVQHAIHYDGTIPLAQVNYNGRDIPSAISGAVAANMGTAGTLVAGALDSSGTNGWTGEIGEIIAYPTALNATEFQAVQNYLATKWDLGLSPPTEGTLHFGQLGAFSVVPERPEYDFLDLSFGKVNYTNPRPAFVPGKTNILLMYPFDKPRDPLPPIETARNRIDAIIAEQDLDELYGVSLGEERGFWAEFDYLSQLYDHIKMNWPDLRVFQWLSRPLTPPATLQADGFIYDDYTTDVAAWKSKMEAHLDTGKELIPVLWASPPSLGFGSPTDLWLDAARQKAAWAEENDLSIMLFAVSDPGPSFNSWFSDPLAEPWRNWVLNELASPGEPVLPGDYNGNGTVDAADYVVWRDNLGASEGTLLNDIDGGAIDQDQYDTWRVNFGATASGTLAAFEESAVPEPASGILLIAASFSVTCFRSRRIWNVPKHARL